MAYELTAGVNVLNVKEELVVEAGKKYHVWAQPKDGEWCICFNTVPSFEGVEFLDMEGAEIVFGKEEIRQKFAQIFYPKEFSPTGRVRRETDEEEIL
jgi:hypothetical protein